MRHRSIYRAFTEFCHNIYERKQIRNFFVRKNFRAWRRLNDAVQHSRRKQLSEGRMKLENRCAKQIQRVWFAYALTIASLAADGSIALDVLHGHARAIQSRVRGQRGRQRAQNRVIAFSAVCVIFSRAWRSIVYLQSRALEHTQVQFEASRAKEERDAMSLADFRALKTQQEWEESVEGIRAISRARVSVAKSPACQILTRGQQVDFVENEALAHARRCRRAEIAWQAMRKFRQHHPPAFECQACGTPFPSITASSGHLCTRRGRGLLHQNVSCEFRSRVLCKTELQTESASDLFAAFEYVENLVEEATVRT